MNLQEKLKQLEAVAEKATPGPWLWGDWTIYDEDREAQRRKEPYWTLISGGFHGNSLCVGPVGRKSLEPDRIAYGTGYEESDIGISDEDATYIATLNPDLVKRLLKVVDKAIMQREILARIWCEDTGLEFNSASDNELLKILEGE